MSSIWQFLCGRVPGGFAVLLVLIFSFLFVWEYLFRVGKELPRKIYVRWRWRVPVVFLGIYFLIWIQVPPQRQPLRIAIVPGQSDGQIAWQTRAVTDLTARRFRNTLKNALVNPWDGAVDYQQPEREVLKRARYYVYEISWVADTAKNSPGVCIARLPEITASIALDDGDLLSLSARVGKWILNDLGGGNALSPAFTSDFSPQVIEAYYYGIQALNENYLKIAEKKFRLTLALDSAFVPAYISLARCAEIEGQFQRAGSLLSAAVKIDTTSEEALLALGEDCLRRYDWEGAEKALKAVLKRNLLQVRAYVDLANIHPERLRDLPWDTPGALLREAVRLDPACEKARLNLAEWQKDKGLTLSARKLIQDGLRINPDSELLLFKLGALEYESGHPEAARSAFAAVLKHNPTNATAAFNLGVVEYHARQLDSALQYFRRSLGMGGPLDCYYYLGLIYKANGNNSKAKFFFQKRWDLRENDEDAFAIKAREMAEAISRTANG